MPELPEVETVRRGIVPLACGRRIGRVVVRCHQLRLPIDSRLQNKISGKTIVQIRRRGKYLIFDLDGSGGHSKNVDGNSKHGEKKIAHKKTATSPLIIIAHLGMSGVFYFSDNPPQEKHEHIGLELGGRFLIYKDPRRFGCFILSEAAAEVHPLLCNLGTEPLTSSFNGTVLRAALHGRTAPIKTALLDGRVVAGVGNIYASESLHIAGIRPQTAAKKISAVRTKKLAQAIKNVLRSALRAGGSTIRDYAQPSGEKGFFQTKWKVYGRENMPCACGGIVQKIQQSGRATYYCRRCQR